MIPITLKEIGYDALVQHMCIQRIEFSDGSELRRKEFCDPRCWDELSEQQRPKVILPKTLKDVVPEIFRNCHALGFIWGEGRGGTENNIRIRRK